MSALNGNNNQPHDNERYKQIKLLGEGSFGKAYLVECQSDGSLCVIKKMDTKSMTEAEKQETVREAHILEALNHPCIVKFREVYKTKKALCIVMDFCDGGDLAKKIQDYKGKFIPENQILDWFTQICLALKHIHDRKIVHRDLKTQNIFLMKDNALKVGDFGIAKVLRHTRENCKTMVGTPYYISPEILEAKPYSFRSDIWSLGVILYEMCAQKPPFDGIGLSNLALKIVKGVYAPISSYYSKDMTQLISLLLNVDPSKRPQVNQILKLPIIQHRIKKFLSETIRQNEFSHTILHNRNFVSNNLNLDNIPSPMPFQQQVRPSIQQNQQGLQQQQQQQQQQISQIPMQQPVVRQNMQPLNNMNNNNNNGLGAFLSPQNRNPQIPPQKPSQQILQQQQPQNILGYLPQNQQQIQQQNNYQLFQNQKQQQPQILQNGNNLMKNNNNINNNIKNEVPLAAVPGAQNGNIVGYKINNNNYIQNNINQAPTPALYMKIQTEQPPQSVQQQQMPQQQQQQKPVPNQVNNNQNGQNPNQRGPQQLLNQQKIQFFENNNDIKRQNNVNAQDFMPNPMDKLRREVSEPTFVGKSKPLFDNLEQKKQQMIQREKALEKKIEEIKENKKEQQYKKIYENIKNDDLSPNLNNYNPNNYKQNNVNNIAPQSKRDSQSTPSNNLGNSKKNLKNQLAQPSEDKEKRKQKYEEERKKMFEDIKQIRQKKLMESQSEQKLEFFMNLKPPKDDVANNNENLLKGQPENEIKKSSKKFSSRDIPVEIYESKKSPNVIQQQQLQQQQQQQQQQQNQQLNFFQNNPQQQNNNAKQRYNQQDYNSSPTKQQNQQQKNQNQKDQQQQNLSGERQNSQGSKDLSDDISYIPHTNQDILQKLLECVGDGEEVNDFDFNSSNSDNSDLREKQNKLQEELNKSVNEIEKKYVNNLERDDDEEEIESDESSKNLMLKLKGIRETNDNEFDDIKSSSDEDERDYVDKEWEECTSREDSDYDEEYLKSEKDYNKIKNKVQLEKNQEEKNYSQKQKQAENKQDIQKQNEVTEYDTNSGQKENISGCINSAAPSTQASSNRSETQTESQLDSLKFIIEEKVGRLSFQQCIKQLKTYLSDQSNRGSQKSEEDDLDYFLFNDLSKLFVTIPQQTANEFGPLIIMYYNMSQDQFA
ncbi:Serine/Threonine kinase domain protein (macronuclear) [Tetrahymena thermophila SB210]|uniref:non-specific serine/threonine protein kinase n=1 Tax=Tetrahymena thermophila (strain SB210) TaxID=312017 RepID=Q22W22_TETTS|nr:Serine/Threonine kinase domain protein [Tetrahymena thermophila SB210]EAR89595.1 Serine/Threonine kinase domain protein [Tetrahymena thermophila SB210]|eukprot:XP_001009840.1 Serine/Threonine kinase domain protein [Tetrahymena thermophila SB210]